MDDRTIASRTSLPTLDYAIVDKALVGASARGPLASVDSHGTGDRSSRSPQLLDGDMSSMLGSENG